MNSLIEAIWELLNAITSGTIKIVKGDQDAPRPKDLPYLVFFTSRIGNGNGDDFVFDGVAEIMTQLVNAEFLIDVRGKGQSSYDSVNKIFAKVDNSNATAAFNAAGFVTFKRTPPTSNPDISRAEIVGGWAMTFGVRHTDEFTETQIRINSATIKGTLSSDKGSTIDVEIDN